jgi:hypothetical protein
VIPLRITYTNSTLKELAKKKNNGAISVVSSSYAKSLVLLETFNKSIFSYSITFFILQQKIDFKI